MKGGRILDLLGSFRNKTIAVLGDYILDQYMIGDTERISREAPVVVVNYRESIYRPGGAANAARNVASLGGRVFSLGVVGDDGEASTLAKLLRDRGVDAGGLLQAEGIKTALKIRIMGGDLHAQKQQVARVDRLYEIHSGNPVLERLQSQLREVLDKSDALLISDYGMGVVPGKLSSLAVEICRANRKPVVVDSRFRLLEYPGATVATPNEVEAFEAVATKQKQILDVEEAARSLLAQAQLESVIVTRGNMGMYVLETSGKAHSIGIIGTSEATDVTGAGDTVAAAVTLTLASGGSMVEAAEMATCAAAVVVMKRGTAEVSPGEIRSLLEKHSFL
jgi:rfaE bifunctional protein kinase chain/domain